MTIHFKPTEDDSLTYQLYFASRSERIRKKRRNAKIRFPIIMAIVIAYTIAMGHYTLAGIYAVFAVAYVIWYTWYEPRHYRKHYLSFVRENARPDELPVSMTFGPDEATQDTATSHATLHYSTFEEIAELPGQILLRMGTQAIIIPKDQVPDAAALTSLLKDIATRHSIPYVDDRTWVWK
ncbi:hypothetical protein GCM10023093_14360 [Nemorincola caseinilytica]|uniref:YcxB-like protein domain-containing protein n=1 Tax=Nemorincola caseinilytica TaxID=2054315 RepID=A0ABP8NAY4_9BACT